MRRKKTKWELEFEKHLVAEWGPVCEAFGIRRPEDDGATLYEFAGRALHDQEVAKLRMDARTQIFDDPIMPAAFDTDWQKLTEILGPEGVARVAARVRP